VPGGREISGQRLGTGIKWGLEKVEVSVLVGGYISTIPGGEDTEDAMHGLTIQRAINFK
jgi:hypothetical protein